jgi:hypothetical protein
MNWQALITVIFVGVAALTVARRFLRILSSKPGNSCGSCGGCSVKDSSLSVTPLVQLGSSPGTLNCRAESQELTANGR